MVQLGYRPQHKAKSNYLALIQGEWRTLVNWWHCFAFKKK